MTKEEAIKTLREDYCGNRIICELYPDQCNREDCEIWWAIKALETQPDGDCISRQAAIDAVNQYNFDFPQYMERFVTELRDAMKADLKHDIEALPSAQPEETCDTCKYGYFGDGMCDKCRVRYQSHYERRTDERQT